MKIAFRHIQNNCVLCHANKLKDVDPMGECMPVMGKFVRWCLLHRLSPKSPVQKVKEKTNLHMLHSVFSRAIPLIKSVNG